MPGIIVFHTLAEAIRMGFRIYDRLPDGYLVQRETEAGRALALVVERNSNTRVHESQLFSDGFERS
ncbi:MAG: hypothetical protein JO302_05625 [Candidatus Eremiobacteraeota bacterium]|nr:hypothetical protein [Candidatus Eremiobacteraeota bacterium]